MIPTDPHDLNLLAGEYVLGVLDEAATHEVNAALADGGGAAVALRAAVTAWEERLHGLTGVVDPVAPPRELWRRIEAQLDAEQPSTARWTGPWRSLPFWRGSTGAAAAAAAALALYVVLAPPAAVPSYVAVLQPAQQQAEPVWLARATGREGGRIALTAMTSPAAVPPDRSLQLWAVRPKVPPRSLGLVPSDGRLVLEADVPLREGATLAISLEPRGGSPTGAPTGPVLYAGELRRLP